MVFVKMLCVISSAANRILMFSLKMIISYVEFELSGLMGGGV